MADLHSPLPAECKVVEPFSTSTATLPSPTKATDVVDGTIVPLTDRTPPSVDSPSSKDSTNQVTVEIENNGSDSTLLTNRLLVGLSTSTDTSREDPAMCRICLSDQGSGSLIRACKCSGSIAHAHRECLSRWLSERQDAKCEICKTPYRQVRRFRACSEWRVPRLSCDTSAYKGLVAAVVLWLCIYYFVMATIPPQNLFMRQAFLYVMYTVMLILITLTLIIVKHSCHSFIASVHRWFMANTFTTVIANSDPAP